MRIQDVLVDGFGIWHDLPVEGLAERMTVFYGRNEAGKTTLMQFLRTVLYGFSLERRARYLPPVHGGTPGGTLRVVVPGGVFDIRRFGSASEDPADLGQVTVHSHNGQRHGSQVLTTLLSGIDESIFNNVFAFGLREVQELGTLDDTDAAEQLYNLTSGLDRVSLVDVMRQLEAARSKLLPRDDESGELPDLLARRQRLRRELEQLATRRERFVDVAAERSRLQREVGELEQRVARLLQESKSVELALRISDTWSKRRELDEQLAKIGAAIDLPDNAIELLDELNTKIGDTRRKLEQLKQQRFQIRQEAAIQPINRKLWSHAARIEALSEQSAWITALETQIRQLGGDAARLEAELGLQRDLDAGDSDGPRRTQIDVSRNALGTLRGPARTLREQLRQLKQVRAEREARRQEAAELARQLELALTDFGHGDLQRAMQEAGEQVARMRRRIQLEERLDKMTRHRAELEEEHGQLMEEQILPVNVLAWLGVPFVLGIALILGGLFWSVSAALGWPIAILGLGGLAVAVIMKMTLERSASRELDECQEQLEQLNKQYQQARQQRDELDAQLPAGGGPLDARLHDAESRVAALEDLLPLDAKRQAIEQRSAAAQHRATQLAESLKQARQRWQAALRSVQLPENMSPQDIRELAEGSEQASQVRRQLQARRDELASRRRELDALNTRITQLAEEVELDAGGDDPQTHLRQMTAALAHQQQLFQRRKVLMQQDRELRKETARNAQELRKLGDRRERLLGRAGAQDDRGFRNLATRELRRRKLTAARDEANRTIAAALQGRQDQETIAHELETHRDSSLNSRWEMLKSQLQDAQRRLSQLHQRRGECIQEMRAMAEDKRVAAVQLDLACVEHQLEQAVGRWRVLAVAGVLLEAIRKTYESERQPETLAEASKYLARLTGGQYVRIWTPLSKNVLKVNDEHGNSLPVEVLSRGTREAVFVSLRLALVAAYARRGAVLPLVLDDVMVNFDAQRLEAAAEVLRDFADAGHQLLMFTCHEHVVRVFQRLQVPVRRISRHGASGEIESLERVPEVVPAETEPAAVVAAAEPAGAAV
ncbi:MAG: AAA family ATPase, partial [Pirellulaceae bacterium]|nr:AAA family ATPase [Pirellulaceae bacterium]